MAELLHRCELLQVRVQAILMPTQARIATQWLFAIVSRILARLEVLAERNDRVDSAEVAEYDAELQRELQRTTEYYERSAALATRVRLITGAVAGLAALAAGAAVVVVAFDSVALSDSAVVAVVAAAVGAVVSVLSRLAQPRLALDTELEPRSIYILGALRPLVGAVLGTAVYICVESELVVIGSGSGSAYYFAALGFLAGFGERFARGLVTAAQDPLFERSAAARYRETVEIVEGLPTAVTQSVRDVLRGPELANWRGYASVSVDGQAHQGATPRAELTLVLRLTPDETGLDNERPIDIRDGVDEDPVVFEARADSDTVYFADDEHPLPVRPHGGAELALPFTAPSNPGAHRIWVQLLQHNRLVQALPVDLEVRENG